MKLPTGHEYSIRYQVGYRSKKIELAWLSPRSGGDLYTMHAGEEPTPAPPKKGKEQGRDENQFQQMLK